MRWRATAALLGRARALDDDADDQRAARGGVIKDAKLLFDGVMNTATFLG